MPQDKSSVPARKKSPRAKGDGKARAPLPPKGTPAPQPDPVLPAVNPAADEHAIPATGLPFPIVGIGASAGGLEAFTGLLEALPIDTGMAFVLIQHLAPNAPSLLSEILARSTKMPVRQVVDNMPVEPDHIYVIPPNKAMVLADGVLQLSPRTETRGQARPVDHFLRSLAEENGHKAIGVVLSGTGNDGTLGLEEIKAAGGITFVQDSTAGQSGMPRSAIAGGAVDYILAPAEIARELARIAKHAYVGPALEEEHLPLSGKELETILGMLRGATGVDFTNYKRNTLYRRIVRRMVLHRLEGGRDYLRMLQATPTELEALYQDVLINVTSFFRNPEAYEALKTQVFPRISADRSRQDSVRIWALGCSTGEEAYSIAIAFSEYLEASGMRVPLQVFATDLNGVGIEKARSGIYAKGIAQDVSPERLRRYFVDIDGSYRIIKPIRDMCVFARQNAISDPPFSRIDLVACRNMLIYLEPVLQQRLIPILHYALRADGFLWLGSSETIGAYRDLFETVDAKGKIYAKKPAARAPASMPLPSERWPLSLPVRATILREQPALGDPSREADRVLLARYAPPGVLLNEELDIVQFRGDTGPYLRPSPGKASLNLLKMLREGLLVGVRGALARARREKLPVREEGLKVRSDGGWRSVNVVVAPLKADGERPAATLVMFEEPAGNVEARARQFEADARAAAQSPQPEPEGSEQELARLKQELSATRDYLQSVIEQQEAANEELQSANEEVQSANEELQSINEELETSKEEIQSSNEELATVNDELQNRNTQLSQSNNDLVNLLASVQMPIVMLGLDLRIRLFTPAAEKLLNLIPADVGRPIGDIKLNLSVEDLERTLLEVIDSVTIHEREVQVRGDRWYSLRIRPYRTTENKIDGAVLMLVDVDGLKKAELEVRESEARFELLANSAPVLIWMSDMEGCRFVNRAFEDFVGAREPDIRASNPARWVHPEEREPYLAQYSEAVRERKPFEARFRFRRADGEYRWMKAMANPRYLSNGELVGYVGCTFDVTDMKEAESALVELDRGRNEFLAMLSHELRNPLSGVRNAAHLLGESRDAAVLVQAREIIERQTANMVRMVDDLLDISRITHGKILLQPEPLDLVAAVTGAIESTAGERVAKNLGLQAKLPESALWVRADRVRLDQIVCNLLGNAAKFSRQDGQIWVSVERELARGDGPAAYQAIVRVRDNGVGIDHALLPRIFDLFVQSDHPTERTHGGIGMGLTLTRRLVELHGGSIEALSAGNALGSEFVVRLPALPPEQVPAVRAKRQDAPVAAAAPSRRVLVVDDNRDAAESLRLMLELAGHKVRAVLDGSAVEAAGKEFSPEVVLLDIGLPDLDGYEVARRLRKLPGGKELLIVAVTGYGRHEDVKRSESAGIDVHLTKPVDPAALEEMIAKGRPRA